MQRVLRVMRTCSVARCLNNRETLAQVISRGLQVAFPHVPQEGLAELKAQMVTPSSAATISRDLVSIDTAIARWWSESVGRDNGPIYLYADSSPILGNDWLLSMALSMPGGSLDACRQAWHSLATTRTVYDIAGGNGVGGEGPPAQHHTTAPQCWHTYQGVDAGARPIADGLGKRRGRGGA